MGGEISPLNARVKPTSDISGTIGKTLNGGTIFTSVKNHESTQCLSEWNEQHILDPVLHMITSSQKSVETSSNYTSVDFPFFITRTAKMIAIICKIDVL